jgi:hypothetical protein
LLVLLKADYWVLSTINTAKGRQLKFPFNIPTSLNGSLSGKEVGGSTTSQYLPVFDIDIILAVIVLAATENFSNELGYGGFGSVYKVLFLGHEIISEFYVLVSNVNMH